jgi:ligand-binding sensor domain-containing protein
MVPVVPHSAIDPAWTFWPAIDLTPGVQAVRTQAEVLWVGTPYGIYRVDSRTGTYTAYEEVGPILMLLPVEAGQVWAVGTDGLFFFDGRQWKKPAGRGGYSFVSSIAINQNGDLWLLYDSDHRPDLAMASHFSGHIPPGGAWSYDHYYVYEGPPGFSMDLTDCAVWSASTAYRTPLECQALKAARALLNVSITLTAVDQDGSLWWITSGTSSDDLTRTLHHRLTSIAADQKLPTARIENMTIDQDLTDLRVNAIAPDPKHGVWLGTDRGLLYSDGETIREISLVPDQLTLRPHPRNLAIDTQGTAWVVTAQGVQQLPAHGSQWQDVTDFGLGPGMNEWPLGTNAAAREGGVWATHGGDLWRFGGSTTTPLTGTVPLDPYCRLIHLTADRDGNVWSPLGGCGVAVFTPQTGQWMLYPFNQYNDPRHYSGAIWELFIDGAGVVYARGDSNRLYRFVPFIASSGTLSQTWQPVAQPDRQLVLGADAQEGQWAVDCQTGEVWRERAGTVTALGKVFTELPDSDCNYSYRWHFDSRSWLWAYDGVNLFRYDGQAWQAMHQPNIGFIADMTTGPDGRVWFVGDRGIAVYDPARDQQP